MRIRENDPILSEDGAHIVAYWGCSMELRGDYFQFAVLSDFGSALTYADQVALDPMAMPPTAEISLRFMGPDRAYWQISRGAPDGWDRCKWFRPVPSDPGPSPAGMVAAIDLVLTDSRLQGGMIEDDLRRIRGYWQYRAEH